MLARIHWRSKRRKALALGTLLGCLLIGFISTPASAHFLLNLNVRILHVEHLSDGLRVYLRTPMPYLVAHLVGPVRDDGLPSPAPFTTNRLEDGKPVHYIDPAAVRSDPLALGRLAGEGFQFLIDGKRVPAKPEALGAYPIGSQPPFATLDEARLAFTEPSAYPESAPAAYVGDVVVDVVLRLKTGAPVHQFAVSSDFNPGLPGQEDTANLILDYGPSGTKVFRARGLLDEPIMISRSPVAAVLTFIEEGVRHILGGWDHVLFVLCLALGASRLKSLIWRATGFTIGHSVTLIAGFFGLVPRGDWFVPSVETGIALSIIYVAAMAAFARDQNGQRELATFLVTTAMGLLHGLGFSFVLHEILRIDSPNIWESLLAFNLGVEFGQIAIILAVWPLFRLTAARSERAWSYGRWSVAAACSLIATSWVFERALILAGSL